MSGKRDRKDKEGSGNHARVAMVLFAIVVIVAVVVVIIIIVDESNNSSSSSSSLSQSNAGRLSEIQQNQLQEEGEGDEGQDDSSGDSAPRLDPLGLGAFHSRPVKRALTP